MYLCHWALLYVLQPVFTSPPAGSGVTELAPTAGGRKQQWSGKELAGSTYWAGRMPATLRQSNYDKVYQAIFNPNIFKILFSIFVILNSYSAQIRE